MKGGVDQLKQMEIELCEHLGLPDLEIETYDDWTNKFNAKELDHEQYLHRLTKRENDKLIAKRKSTCIEIKRLREQNQSLKRELEQAVAALSRSFWQRLRTMGKKAR